MACPQARTMAYSAGIVLISAATLLLELSLLRLFAVQQFYHFAFMAVSLALLGAGAGGSVLAVRGRPLSPLLGCVGFCAGTVAAYLAIDLLPFDAYRIAWEARQVLYLALYFLAVAVPFFFSGLLVGSELMRAGQTPGRASHRVYGANLIGSAAGCALSLPALAAWGGEGAVAASVGLAALAGIAFALAALQSADRRLPTRLVGWVSAFLGVLLAALWLLAARPALLELRLSPYKGLTTLLAAHDAQRLLTAWDATARVDVVASSTVHVLPGLSLLSPVPPPPQDALFVDGDGLMPISKLPPDSEPAAQLAAYVPTAVAYWLRPQPRALVAGAGTGHEVLIALAAGASTVTAADERRLVLEIVRDRYADATGNLYRDPRVSLVPRAGRTVARAAAPGSFDLVVLALTDPFRPVTSGAFSLTESYGYTVEAFGDHLRALADDDGLLVASRWLQTPPSESARLFATAAQALREAGLEPAPRLIAFRSLRTMTLLVAKTPFTAAELAEVRAFLASRAYDAVYLPDLEPSETNRFLRLPEEMYVRLFAALLSAPEATYRSYPFDLRPARDDRPFFYHYFRWRQTPELLAQLGRNWQPFGGSGVFVLLALAILVALAAAVFIAGPLLLRGWLARATSATPPRRAGALPRWRVLLYFACVGLAFLFVEIPLAQRFILIFGNAVTALAVVLAALLLASGLGSLTAARWRLRLALPLLALVAAIYPWAIGAYARLALTWPPALLLASTLLLLAPLGYLMGLPFVLGLRMVEQGRRGEGRSGTVQEVAAPDVVAPEVAAPEVAWGWAVNGSFSVLSAVLAVLMALFWGFSAVLLLGAVAYGVAWLALAPLERTVPPCGGSASEARA